MDSRRHNVPFDPYHFEKEKEQGRVFSVGETFRRIYDTNHWGGRESVSGAGAGRIQTRAIEAELPALLEAVGADVLLDAPCGDYSWMRFVALPVSRYIGADIVPDLIARNRERYGDARHHFMVLDLTSEALPAADVLLCRDGLVHFSFAAIRRAIRNLKQSRIAYLLTTTFPACDRNEDITTGDWRVLNMQKAPFHFPEPLRLLDERCSEGDGAFRDKSLGLWRVEALPEPGLLP